VRLYSILYYIRNQPDVIRDSLVKRGYDPKLLDDAINVDIMWRRYQRELDDLRHKKNIITKNIGRASSEERSRLIEEARKIDTEVTELNNRVREIKAKLDKVLSNIPNIVSDDVPIGDESKNKVIRVWGKAKVMKMHLDAFIESLQGFKMDYEVVDYDIKPHADWTEGTGLGDTARAAKVAGARFYYLIDDLVYLDLALIMYAIDYLSKKGYKIIEPPHMIRRRAYEGVVTFDAFEDTLYKIEDEDLYLIATSEHPLAAYFMDEVLEENELPIKFAGVSPCYRKEATAHGRDMKGIFRVHQFNKVEQFIFSLPEDSLKYHEEILNNAEELFRGLEIPYRIVIIASEDMNRLAIKQYDLEAWMPSQGKFREMVSASNCTDWQSYRLNIRYAERRGMPSKGYVHTLNSTAIATQRTITAIIENHQEPDGTVIIPKVLRKYLEVFSEAPKEAIYPVKKVG